MENISALLGEVITKRGKDNISKEKDMEESLDYVDEKTNLLTCGHCHTAKEKLIDFMGDKKKVHISCKCMQEKEREEKEARRKYQQMLRINELRRYCFEDSIFLKARFENMDRDSEHRDIAENYVDKFEEVYKNNLGLILTGDVGCGKTHLAATIANGLIDQCISVKMTNFTSILNDMTNFDINKGKYINSLNEKKLLIIDDFGMERTTDFAYEHIFNIIDARYRVGKPLIITTNLNISQLTNPIGVREKRIYSRILEMASPIIFTGKNRRIKKMKDKSNLIYELLKEGEICKMKK